jgi:hypothetical protein
MVAFASSVDECCPYWIFFPKNLVHRFLRETSFPDFYWYGVNSEMSMTAFGPFQSFNPQTYRSFQRVCPTTILL